MNRDGDNTQIALYHNGSIISSGAYNETFNGSMGLSTIIGSRLNNGGHYSSSVGLAGIIREMIVFDSPLTDQEISKIHYYLSKKWGLEATVDSDGDGFTDAVEISLGSSAMDASDIPMPDFSDTVDTQIGEASSLDSVESNLKLWLDASNIDVASNATLSNGDAISTWRDLSGNGQDAIQTSSSSQPIIKTNQLNGLATIDFDGSNDHLLGDYQTSSIMITSIIFLVKKQDSTAQSTFYSTNADVGYNYLDITNWTNNTYTYFNQAVTGVEYWITGVEMSPSTFEIYSVRFNSTDNSQASYYNGAYILDQTLHHKYKYDHDIVTKQLNNYIIAKRPGNNDTLNGEIAELIIFDQPLEDDEMSAVHAYLSKKWGLESIVDSDSDGVTDAIEETAGTSAIDASDFPMPDFSDTVDTQIGEASSLDSVESNLKLWLDASNIDAASNATLSNGDAISTWRDLSGNGQDAIQTSSSSQPIIKNKSIKWSSNNRF